MAQEKKRGPGRPKGSKNKNKSKNSASREKIQELQQKRESSAKMRDIIWGICYIALGALTFFAVQFHEAGEVGNTVGDILKGCLGVLGLVLPWYLIALGIMLITHIFAHFSTKTFVVSLVMLFLLCIVNSGMYIDSDYIVFDFVEFYQEGVALKSGGVIGMTLGSVIVKLLGKAGLFIISIAGIAICLLLTLNTPISAWLKKRREIREETILLKEAEAEKEQEEMASQQSIDQLPEHSYDVTRGKHGKKEKLLDRLFGIDEDDVDNESQDETDDNSSDIAPVFPETPEIINTNIDESENDKKSGFKDLLKSANLFNDKNDRDTDEETEKLDPDELMKAQEDNADEEVPGKIKVTNKEIADTAKEINENKAKKKKAYKKPSIDLLELPERANNAGANEEL